MSWRFLYLVRRGYHTSEPWGTLFIRGANSTEDNPQWEKRCYTYELPWVGDKHGQSTPTTSRIDIGTYEMVVRTDGPKGWRLELLGTEPRKYIQLHRAHKSMYIEGCILPVTQDRMGTFPYGLEKDEITQFMSEILIDLIKSRYEALAKVNAGNPTITIAATLPAEATDLISKGGYA